MDSGGTLASENAYVTFPEEGDRTRQKTWDEPKLKVITDAEARQMWRVWLLAADKR